MTGRAGVGTNRHSRVHGLCAHCTPRRRHRGVAAAPTSQCALGLLLFDTNVPEWSCTWDHARVGAWPEPTDAVGEVDAAPQEERGAEAKGVPLEHVKPAPSEYPHATALGKFAAPRQNPHVLPPGFGSTHPEGWVNWVWLIGYKRGGARKR